MYNNNQTNFNIHNKTTFNKKKVITPCNVNKIKIKDIKYPSINLNIFILVLYVYLYQKENMICDLYFVCYKKKII